jgi:hypothetical protein
VYVVQSALKQLNLAAVVLEHQYKYGNIEHCTDDEQEDLSIGQYHFFFLIVDAKVNKKSVISK